MTENSISVNKEKDGNMNRKNGISHVLMRNKSINNEDVKKILETKKLLESRSRKFLKVSHKNFLMNILKNRSLFNSLTEVMGGE